MARRGGWRILLRIEDLDSPRVKQGSDREAIEFLGWLGIDWDEGPVYQSAEMGVYTEAMERLARAGAVYPSAMSRGAIEAALGAGGSGLKVATGGGLEAESAPQEGSHEVAFPARLRPDVVAARAFDERDMNWRLVVGDERGEGSVVRFDDGVAGRCEFEVARIVGDFLVWTKRGVPAYQLAVVVDDARQGVTQVVRGDDLLDSTARQILVARALGLSEFAPTNTQDNHLNGRGRGFPAPPERGAQGAVPSDRRRAPSDGSDAAASRGVSPTPDGLESPSPSSLRLHCQYTHLPLVRGTDGKRLAKRHGDTRLRSYKAAGVRAERVIGLIAAWSGVLSRAEPREMSAAEFRERFDLTRMPRESVVLTPEDEQWLAADRSL